MSTQEPGSEWISQAEAARIRRVTRQAISKLVKAGRLKTLRFGGHQFVRRDEVEEFEPMRSGKVEESAPEYIIKPRASMSEIEELWALIDRMSDAQKREVLERLRERLPIHPLETDWNVSAEVILEAISRSSDLTQRGVRGVIAEAIYVVDVLPHVAGWTPVGTVGAVSYDAIMRRDADGVRVRIQVKLQRKKAGRPMMAAEGYRDLSGSQFCVEVQRTRGGKSSTGDETRPYRFGEFDLISVCMEPSTGDWRRFMSCPAHRLEADPKNDSIIRKFQAIPPEPTGPWTDNLREALEAAAEAKSAE